MPRRNRPSRSLPATDASAQQDFPIFIDEKDVATFNPSNDDVLQKAGDIDACVTWHAGRVAKNMKMS